MSASRPYLAQMAQAWTAFRHYELRSAAEAAGVALSFDGTLTAESILLPVQLPDDASVMKLAARAVLVKSFIDVWATGTTWEEMSAALLAYPRPDAAPYLAEGTTFKVVINKIGRKQTDEERIATIRSLEPLLPWKGKVRMKRADHTFVVIDDDTCDGGPATARFYFGRVVAEGRRDLVGKLDLKKRNYIGTTSLDAELSLLMANLARVRPNDIVYDPFCGTAGTLVAAGAFGAPVLGCDLHLPALRGELRTRSGPSKLLQAAKPTACRLRLTGFTATRVPTSHSCDCRRPTRRRRALARMLHPWLARAPPQTSLRACGRPSLKPSSRIRRTASVRSQPRSPTSALRIASCQRA
jgi:tRNA G10  N-methylase Trm11